MTEGGQFDVIPLWMLLPLTVLVVGLALEGGYRLGRHRLRQPDPESSSTVGGIVAASTGLLGLMVAFTFGLAAARFETRRQLVLDEANAIGTAYLRASLLPDPHSGEIRRLLREYVAVRLDAVQGDDWDRALSASVELQDRLWKEATAVVQQDRSAITAIFVDSLNTVIDLHSSRVQAGLRSRIPGSIWSTLFGLALLSMVGMGYHVGLSDRRRTWTAVCLAVTFSATLVLIVDLDRPREGTLMVNQQAMTDLAESMEGAD
jgi:hypothetical protein